MIRSCGISHVRLVIMIGRAATVLLLAGGSSAALRAPVAPALDGYPLTRGLGLLPSFRRDSVGCLAAHAQHCRQSGLDAVAMDMGLLGRFTMITGPEQLAFLLEDRQNIFYKSAIDRRGVGLLTGIGVLLADGKEHTRKRRLVLPSFEARRLEQYLVTMSTVSNELADDLLHAGEAGDGAASLVPVASTMSAAALRIVGLCLFSSDPSSSATASFGHAVEACLEHAVWVSRNAASPPRWLPTPRNRRFRRSLRTLDDFVYGLINERRRYSKSGAKRAVAVIARARGQEVDEGKGDLLDMLLEAQIVDGEGGAAGDDDGEGSKGSEGGEGERGLFGTAAAKFRSLAHRAVSRLRSEDRSGPVGLSAREVRDEAMTLMLAGHETSALALSWCLHYLSAEDMVEWRAAIAEEGRELLRTGASPAMLERGLPKTRAALCEALRLRPPAWAFDREVQKAVTLPGGLELRRGEIVLVSPYAQHQDPDVFANPLAYDPARFIGRGRAAAAPAPAAPMGAVSSWYDAGYRLDGSSSAPAAPAVRQSATFKDALQRDAGDPWDGPFAKYEYLPFGQGRRRCIGYRFARWEMLVVLATLLARVEITRPEGYVEPLCDGSVTLRPASEIELNVQRREMPLPEPPPEAHDSDHSPTTVG